MNLIDIVIVLIVGIFATHFMDLLNRFLSNLNIIEFVDQKLLGRLVHGWLNGRFLYDNIAEAEEVKNEQIKGIIAHYAIGSMLATALAYFFMFTGINNNIMVISILFGSMTTAFAWFVIFPSVGFGRMGLNAPNDSRMCRTSLINHVGYGVGLAVGFTILKYIYLFVTQSSFIEKILIDAK